MPAILAQATILTIIELLAVWSGLILLLFALFPGFVSVAGKSASGAVGRLCAHGVIGLCLLTVGVVLRTVNSHAVRLLGYSIVAIVLVIASVGACGVVHLLAGWLSRKPLRFAKSGPLPVIVASILVTVPIAIPRLGTFLAVIDLFACSGVGIISLRNILKGAPKAPSAAPEASRSSRLIFIISAVALIAFAKPAFDFLFLVRYPVMFSISDGTTLATDVYLPRSAAPYPALVVRTHDNKDTQTPFAVQGVDNGYAMVLQDCRGRFGSRGESEPFNGEADDRPNDGMDTLEWLASWQWCNGHIGTYGTFADGINQLSMDAAGTDRVKSQYIALAAPSLYQYLVYPGGVFRKNDVETWLSESHYSQESLSMWVAHPDYDDYWIRHDMLDRWGRVYWPVMHVGGWFDTLSQGTLDSFIGMQTQGGSGARDKQKLIMGPWGHELYTSRIGDVRYPEGAYPPAEAQDPIRWFNYTLKGELNGADKLPAVTYYVLGDTAVSGAPGNVWRSSDVWPPTNTLDTAYYLHAGKALSTTAPASDPAITYAFDPNNPVPTVGGPHIYLAAGPRDQSKIESRSDVLTFSTEPLATPTEVTGRVRMKLFVSSDAPDTDFFVKLCDVYPDGRSLNICEGQLCARFRYGFLEEQLMKTGEVYPLDIDLWSTSIIFNKGHRIRVTVTSSNSPAFNVNPNTADRFRTATSVQTAHNSIYMDSAHPSAITLPVARSESN